MLYIIEPLLRPDSKSSLDLWNIERWFYDVNRVLVLDLHPFQSDTA